MLSREVAIDLKKHSKVKDAPKLTKKYVIMLLGRNGPKLYNAENDRLLGGFFVEENHEKETN